MKVQRQILGISQAKLAERVDTSTHYIGMIESEKKFPKPEMLERIAVAFEIEHHALFTAEIRPLAESEALVKVHKQILGDITKLISYRIKQIGQETGLDGPPGMDNGSTIV